MQPTHKPRVKICCISSRQWEMSRKIREAVEVPIFLAGGLNSENVGEAIRQVGPFRLDLCSSVRTNGLLDEAKLARFFERFYSAIGMGK